MMNKFLFGCCLFFVVSIADAQKKMLTVQDAMLKARTTLAPENLKMLQFVKGTGDYVYIKKINNIDCWMRGSHTSKIDSCWLSLVDVNARLKGIGWDTLTSMPPMKFDKQDMTVTANGRKVVFSLKDNSFSIIIDKTSASYDHVEESLAGLVAYVKENDLYVSDKGEARRITTDGSKDIVYASSVHRDEFGISKGTFWSPGGKKLAFYRMDQSMVKDYPVIDWTTVPATVTNIKYPMAGDSSHQVTVHMFDAASGKCIRLKTPGPDDHYLTNIAWSPDERYIIIAELNRGQDHMKLNMYDAASGDFVKTLLQEKTDRGYVEPLVPVLFLKNTDHVFLYQSRIDGFNHLYLFDMKSSKSRQLTSGNWEVVDVKGFDASGDNLFFISTEVSPLSRNLYKLNIKSGKKIAITSGNAVHNVQVSTDGMFALDIFSDVSNPRSISIIDMKSGKTRELLQAENPLKDYATGALSVFPIPDKSRDFDLYCRMYKPVDFDSMKKYPVVVYWYGGPHNQLITNSWNGGAGDYWFQYMAENGFVVFSIDVRGSSYRGVKFEQQIFRNVGIKQMEDLMTGVEYLKTLPFVDASRMGLFGWSFGGFLTTNFMLTYPGVFKSAVAGGPVIDWRMYEIMYTERYMDTPAENPEGYEATNLTKRVGNLKGKLLMIHGLQDPVVVQQHSVNFVKAAVSKGVQVDYMIYPGHEHNVLGADRAHLYQKVTDYFFQYLK